MDVWVDRSSIYGSIWLDPILDGLVDDPSAVVLKDIVYQVDVGENDHDLINVGGNVSVDGGFVNVRSHISQRDNTAQKFSGHSYVIMQADGDILGKFDGVENDLAFWHT